MSSIIKTRVDEMLPTMEGIPPRTMIYGSDGINGLEVYFYLSKVTTTGPIFKLVKVQEGPSTDYEFEE